MYSLDWYFSHLDLGDMVKRKAFKMFMNWQRAKILLYGLRLLLVISCSTFYESSNAKWIHCSFPYSDMILDSYISGTSTIRCFIHVIAKSNQRCILASHFFYFKQWMYREAFSEYIFFHQFRSHMVPFNHAFDPCLVMLALGSWFAQLVWELECPAKKVSTKSHLLISAHVGPRCRVPERTCSFPDSL